MLQLYYAAALLLLTTTVQHVQTKPVDGSLIVPRGDDDPLPPELQPVLQDDKIPSGASGDILEDTDDTFSQSDLEATDDYDPDQATGDSGSKFKRTPARKGTTLVLRNVGYMGKKVRQAFEASGDKLSLGVKSKGVRSMKNPVSLIETKELLKVNANNPWQGDHVNDLGIWASIAKRDNPPGVTDETWTATQDAILGVSQDNGDPKANDNSKTLGKILNAPQNIRGISRSMNSAKNFMMTWAYSSTTDTPKFYKNTRRSNVWGLLRYMTDTKAQFDDTTTKGTTALGQFIKDPAQATLVQTYFKAEIEKIWEKSVNQLKKDLKELPSSDPSKKVFGQEDCSNTSDDEDTPPGSQRV